MSNVVTSENLQEFNANFLRLDQSEVLEGKKEEPKLDAKDEESASEESTEESTLEEKEQQRKNGLKGRFKQLTDERNKARQEAQERAEESARLKAELEQLKKPPKDPSAKPNANDFKDAFEYAEALSEWKVGQVIAEREKAEREAKLAEYRESISRSWQAKVKQAEAEIPDYEEVIAQADYKLVNDLRDAILESDIGPRVQYYFAQNPEEVERFNKMNPAALNRAFGKLEAKIEADAKPKVEEKAKPKAPEPITPLKGLGEVPTDEPSDYKAYKAQRQAQMESRRRR
jgi:hypothetical protein